MAATSENPRAVFRKLPRKNLANFKVNVRSASESIVEFIERSRLTPEQIAWAQSLPVNGTPDLNRLRIGLANAGFADIQFQLSGHDSLSFTVRLTGQVSADDSASLLRQWVATFRCAGFRIGLEEIGIDDVDGPLISGTTWTGPLEEVAEGRAPVIELERVR
jgi:hypothetical protein